MEKKLYTKSCQCDRHSCMLTLVPLHVTKAVIVFIKTRKILLFEQQDIELVLGTQ